MSFSSTSSDGSHELPTSLTFEEQSRVARRWIKNTRFTLCTLSVLITIGVIGAIGSFVYTSPHGFATVQDHLGLRLVIGIPSGLIALYSYRLLIRYWEGPADKMLAEHMLDSL